MKAHSDWHESIAKEVGALKDTLNEKDYKKYRLDLLLCVARRIADFSPECGQCQLLRQDVTTLVHDVGNLVQMTDKERRRTYFNSVKRIIAHLQRQHKLVTEGYYMGIGAAIGAGFGVALGLLMDQTGVGMPIGAGTGLSIGAALDSKAQKEGRVLCPREATDTRKNVKIIVGIGVALVLAGIVAFLLFRRLG